MFCIPVSIGTMLIELSMFFISETMLFKSAAMLSSMPNLAENMSFNLSVMLETSLLISFTTLESTLDILFVVV